MNKGLLLVVILIVQVITISSSQAKARCKPLLQKLQNIQAMQRHGYSLKKGISLRKREDKAREKWWQCEQGRGNQKTKKKVAKSKRPTAKLSGKNKPNKLAKVKPSDFSGSSVIARQKYQGSELQQWLKFYQQPKQCQRPKSLAIFADCAEDKQQQMHNFELKNK